MDIQYLTLLERILFLLVEFSNVWNWPGNCCRECVDAGCRLECCFYRVELLEACLCCMALECCREAGSLILPCRMLGDTGNSCWKMPCSEPARDEPCSCSISCRRINSVHSINCGNLELLDCVWKHCSSCRNTLYSKKSCNSCRITGNTLVLELD